MVKSSLILLSFLFAVLLFRQHVNDMLSFTCFLLCEHQRLEVEIEPEREHICPTAFNCYSHMLTLLSANIQQFLSFSEEKKKRKTIPPCTFLLLRAKWNTYIRHHCGLHKCLKLINISSSVRLMCLVIGYLCCGLPLSSSPFALS